MAPLPGALGGGAWHPFWVAARWAAVRIGPEPPTPAEWARLPPGEAEYGASLKGDKRRREWFAGRWAARAVLVALGAPTAELLPDEEGAPVLHGPGVDELELSLSHGGVWALCAGHRRSPETPHLGVDLVDDADAARAGRVLDRHLSAPERALLEGDPNRAGLLWGAREAVAKATRTGMFAFALLDVSVTALDEAAGELSVGYPGCWLRYDRPLPGTTLLQARVRPEAARAAQAAADRRRQA